MALNDYEDVLKSYIHDDDKLVTYKWLSKELEIHVNAAKDILKQYWEKYKDVEKIVATFLLIGQLKDKSIRVEVVKESNLNAAKEKYIKVDCEHLYSLQKYLTDVEILTSAGEGDLRYSAIKCNDEYMRNDEEIESLRYVGNDTEQKSKVIDFNKIPLNNKKIEKQEPKSVVTSNKNVKDVKSKTADIKDKEKTKEAKETKEPKETKEISVESKSKQISTSSEKKTSPTNKSNGSSKTNNKTKKPVQSKQSGFNNLFGKVSSKPTVSSKPEENGDIQKKDSSLDTVKKDVHSSKETDSKQEKEKEKEKDKDKSSPEKENKDNQHKKKNNSVSKIDEKVDTKKKPKPKDTRGKKRNRSQEDNKLSKRKRIVVMDSSEDESNKSNNEDEEEEEAMEVEEEPPKTFRKKSPSPPTEKHENGKRMIRKAVDKMFKDEDGYLVTKRTFVYEAVSDNEEKESVKKEEIQKPKPVVDVKAKKQTTLTNFFKKS